MIVGWFLDLIASLVRPLVDGLPSASLSLPDPTPVGDALCRVNALLPIAGPLALAVTVLGFLGAFLALRLAVWAWKLVLP